MVHQNRSNFRFWLPVQIWNDLWPIILCNLKTKHRRYIKLYIFWILMTRQTIWHYLQRNRSMFQFSTHMELSRSMAAILEMPQYVAYQKNVVYAFIKLSAKSHSFNILCTMDGLSCPTSTCAYHRTKVGGIWCKISLKKVGHSVWAPRYRLFFGVDSKKLASFSVQKCNFMQKFANFMLKLPWNL